MKCKECEKTIGNNDSIVVKRTKGAPSIIARYPSMRVCIDCYEKGEYTLFAEEEGELEPDVIPKFEVTHLCSNCNFEYSVVTEEVDGKMIIATSMCPQCKRIDKLYLNIKRV